MNNTLKSALLGTASFALMFAAADRAANAQTGFDGIYVGAQIGYHSFGSKESSQLEAEESFAPFNSLGLNSFFGGQAENGRRSLSGVTGGLFAGYGRTFNRFYVGAEIEGGFSGASNKSNRTITLVEGCSGGGTVGVLGQTSVKAKESYGAALRLGYLLTDSAMIYTKFGFQRTKFKVQSSITDEGGLTVGLINKSKTFNGFRFGVGAEILLASMFGPTVNLGNTFLRVDWSHTWYGSKTFSAFNEGSAVSPSRILSGEHSISIKPSESKFMLGVGIRF